MNQNSSNNFKSNKIVETNQKPAGGFLIAHFKRCSFPLAETSNAALSTERATSRLPVSATLRPTIARSHTLSRLPENPPGFSEIRLSGTQRGVSYQPIPNGENYEHQK